MWLENLFLGINRLLTPKRLAYPWLIGGALWLGWIISIIAGDGNTDYFGQLIGTDFAGFYSAGKIILMGESPRLYDINLSYSIQQALYGQASSNFNFYMNPPNYAIFMVLFALIPYPWAPLLWLVTGLVIFWFGIKWLDPQRTTRIFLLGLTWFPVFCAASFGQNSFFSFTIFSLTYFLSSRNRSLLAGLVYSLLLFKPHFLIAIGVVWLLGYRKNWRSLVGLLIGLFVQISITFLLLPQASLKYISYIFNTVPNMLRIEGSPMYNAYSLVEFLHTLLPNLPQFANILYIILVLASTFLFITVYIKYSGNKSLIYSFAIMWMIWSIPYLNVYDWTLLLFPAILLWKTSPDLRPLLIAAFSFLWVVAFFSSSLTYLQLKLLPFAIQISLPALFLVMLIFYRRMRTQQTADHPSI